MAYFELLGLPSSGKTALLKSFRRWGHQSRDFDMVLSEDIRVSLHRIGLHGLSIPLGRDKGERAGRVPWLNRQTALDGWQMGVLSKYPDVLSQVFGCLQAVSPENRQREIILNYWRTRLYLYESAANMRVRSHVLVDEGLAQTAYSTLVRMSPSLVQGEERVESLIRSLPSNRTIIFLRTPIDVIEDRTRRAGRAQPQQLSLRAKLMVKIFEKQIALGVESFELDGSKGIHQLRTDLQYLFSESGVRCSGGRFPAL